MGREGVLQEATKKKKLHGEGNVGFRDWLATILSPWRVFFFFLLSSILQTVKYIVCKIKGIVMK